jgi:hypothetical protein
MNDDLKIDFSCDQSNNNLGLAAVAFEHLNLCEFNYGLFTTKKLEAVRWHSSPGARGKALSAWRMLARNTSLNLRAAMTPSGRSPTSALRLVP